MSHQKISVQYNCSLIDIKTKNRSNGGTTVLCMAMTFLIVKNVENGQKINHVFRVSLVTIPLNN